MTADAAMEMPMHSAWNTVLWDPSGADMCMFRSSENNPYPVPELVLDPSVKIHMYAIQIFVPCGDRPRNQ